MQTEVNNKIESERNEIEITKPKPEDARAINEVFYKTWLATYPNEQVGVTVDDIEDRYKDSFTAERLEKRADHIANMPAGECQLVAKDGEKIIGICVLEKQDDGNHLRAIYVLPEYQGRGIGQKFWAEAQNFFNPEKDIYVEVASYNENAIKFYQRLGFQKIGEEFTNEHFRLKSGAVLPEIRMVIKRTEAQ